MAGVTLIMARALREAHLIHDGSGTLYVSEFIIGSYFTGECQVLCFSGLIFLEPQVG
jgi:hypothetical protein